MLVRAIKPGFYDINKTGHPEDIAVGRVFEFRGDKPGLWMERVEAPKPADPKPETPKPAK